MWYNFNDALPGSLRGRVFKVYAKKGQQQNLRPPTTNVRRAA